MSPGNPQPPTGGIDSLRTTVMRDARVSRRPILIVDDDPIALEMLSAVLEEQGYAVRTACDGAEALPIILAGECRMVISDWQMPGMDGLELCRTVRSENLPYYVYIILLTGKDGASKTVEGLSAGADDFITKPFNPAELSVRIRAGERVLSLETRDIAIFAMAKLAESRDPETGAHLERVCNYSRILAEHLRGKPEFERQIDAEFVRLIYLTSSLHDIGKVGIPDSVLLKPGRLNDREFEIMKAHTELGAITLTAAIERFPDARFLTMARDIAVAHHERWDGEGYPSGLAGEAIPLAARIVAMADVYDALTSRRVYKPAYGHDVTRSMILSDAGTHLDPRIVEAFLEIEQRFLDIREQWAEPQHQPEAA